MVKAAASPILQFIRHVVEDQCVRELSDQQLLQRFHDQQDQAAFQVLLRRHGPMVFDVCRGVLSNEADAEDAFQATFLIFARKAGSIRKTEALGSWLHGVAYRTALKARAQSATRHKREAGLPERQTSNADDLTWRELQQALHEEVSGLPERYRAALVLCYLEGATQDAAAAQLGVAKCTLRERLERGRALLRTRLLRRGLGPAALLVAAAWPAANASASVPESLLVSTVKAASLFAAGDAATACLSPKVAALTQGVMKAMFMSKLKIATAVLMMLAALGTGVVALTQQVLADKPAALKGHTMPVLGVAKAHTNQDQGGAGKDEKPEKPANEAAARTQSAENLRKLVIAMHKYHDANEAFPPAALHKDGKPLLSWRVLVLPYLGEKALYDQFKLDEPWDSAHNKKLLVKMPRVFAPVAGVKTEPSMTFYQVFAGPGAIFDGPEGRKVQDITDGTSYTLMMAEAAQAVPWTKPADLAFDLDARKPLPKLGGLFKAGFHAAAADSSMWFVKKGFSEETLHALITRNGMEEVQLKELGEFVPASAPAK